MVAREGEREGGGGQRRNRERESEREEKRRRVGEGVSDKPSETRGGGLVCLAGDSERYSKEGGRKRGREDADVGVSQRKHDMNRLELHKCKSEKEECERSDKRRQMCKERVKSNSAGKK